MKTIKLFSLILAVFSVFITSAQIVNPCDLLPDCNGRYIDQINNGDFVAAGFGNNGASTNVGNTNVTCTLNSWLITNNSQNLCPNAQQMWPLMTDFNNPGIGNMLVIDSPPDGTVIWQHDIELEIGENYIIELAVLPAVSNILNNLPLLQVQLVNDNNNTVAWANTFIYTSAPNEWNCSQFFYNSTLSGDYRLEILQVLIPPGGSGDYAIDNIHFWSCEESCIDSTFCDTNAATVDEVINGNFDNALLAPATTDIVNTAGNCSPNSCNVVLNSFAFCNNPGAWFFREDYNNPGFSNMLAIDSPPANTVVWEQSVNLVQNANYNFELAVLPSLSVAANPTLTIQVQFQDNPPIVLQTLAANDYGLTHQWNNFCIPYTHNGVNAVSGAYQLQIIHNQSTGGGNFALDNIHLRRCCEGTFINISPSPDLCVSSSAFNLSAIPAGGSWSGSGITNSATGTFNPGFAGVGTHTVTYTDPSGCISTIDIQVGPAPIVEATYPTYTVCCGDGSFNIGHELISANNVYYTYDFFTSYWVLGDPIGPQGGQLSGTFNTIIDPAYPQYKLYQFDPCSVGPGIYPITYTYTDPTTGCSNSAIMNIEVIDDNWHQTTSNSYGLSDQADVGNDIYTDEVGYVYATGSYYYQTTFDDNNGNAITITSENGEKKNFYLVCYSPCGELEWVVYDKGFMNNDYWSEGFGVSKHKKAVFVGLNYQTETNLWTAFPNNSPLPIQASIANTPVGPGNERMAFLAVGGPNHLTPGQIIRKSDNYQEFSGRALYTDPSDTKATRLFACGRSDDNGNPNDYNAFGMYFRFNVIQNFIGVQITKSLQEDPKNVANDIKWDAHLERTIMTGTFHNDLTFPGSGTTQITNAQSDAFSIALQPNTLNAIAFSFWKFGIDDNGWAEGTCLTSNDDNFFVYGGNFRGHANTPFGYSNMGAMNSQSPQGSSYIFTGRINPGHQEYNEIWDIQSYTRLTGMDAYPGSNYVAFTGYYGRGPISTNTGTSTVNNTGPLNYVFTGRLDLGQPLYGNPDIVNGTWSTLMDPWDHQSTRVSTNGDLAFFTGRYKGNMNFWLDASTSGPLSSTPIYSYNAYYTRQQLGPTFSYKNTVDVMSIQSESVDENLLISAYPNPTTGITTIQIQELESDELIHFEVFNAVGQMVYSNQTGNTQFQIDLTQFEKGIYILKINLGNKIETLRLTKS